MWQHFHLQMRGLVWADNETSEIKRFETIEHKHSFLMKKQDSSAAPINHMQANNNVTGLKR